MEDGLRSRREDDSFAVGDRVEASRGIGTVSGYDSDDDPLVTFDDGSGAVKLPRGNLVRAEVSSSLVGLLLMLALGVQGLVASYLLLASQVAHHAKNSAWAFYALQAMPVAAGTICALLASRYDRGFDKVYGMAGASYIRLVSVSAAIVVTATCLVYLPGGGSQAAAGFILCFLVGAVVLLLTQLVAVIDERKLPVLLLVLSISQCIPVAVTGAAGLDTAKHWSHKERAVFLTGPVLIVVFCAAVLRHYWPEDTRRGSAIEEDVRSALGRLSLEGGRPQSAACPGCPLQLILWTGVVNGAITMVATCLIGRSSSSATMARMISERFVGELGGQLLGTAAVQVRISDGFAPHWMDYSMLLALTGLRIGLGAKLLPGYPDATQAHGLTTLQVVSAVQQCLGSAIVVAATPRSDRRAVARTDSTARWIGSLLGVAAAAPLMKI